MLSPRPILTITGSDPMGGSGVQADIKIISSLGGYALSAVTSVTMQNTLGIQDFYDLPAAVVEGQIEAVVNDFEPRTVKIGLIRTEDTLSVIVDMLSKYRPQNVVYMPFTTSSRGERLLSAELASQIRQRLLPLCTVVVEKGHFSSHGDANTYASAVAHWLNEGVDTEESLRRARQFMLTQTTISVGAQQDRSQKLFMKFLRELEIHFRTKGDVGFYADRLNVGSGYLAQVARRMDGHSPKAIIDSRICQEAERELTTTAKNVQEIAYELGFSSQAHFARFFKKQKGLSPTEFRRQAKYNNT